MSKAAIISSFVATLIVSVEIISTSVRAIIASLAVSAWALVVVSVCVLTAVSCAYEHSFSAFELQDEEDWLTP